LSNRARIVAFPVPFSLQFHANLKSLAQSYQTCILIVLARKTNRKYTMRISETLLILSVTLGVGAFLAGLAIVAFVR